MEEMLNEKTMQIEESKQESQSTTNTGAELPTKSAEGVQPENPSKNRRGIVFISNIPLGLNPSLVKQKLSEIGTITRIHLEPKNKYMYKCGWVEFEDKIFARLCALRLNGKEIGGKRSKEYSDQTWNLRYISKVTWQDVFGRRNFIKESAKQKASLVVSQAKKEAEIMYSKSRAAKAHKRTKQKEKGGKKATASTPGTTETNKNEKENQESIETQAQKQGEASA